MLTEVSPTCLDLVHNGLVLIVVPGAVVLQPLVPHCASAIRVVRDPGDVWVHLNVGQALAVGQRGDIVWIGRLWEGGGSPLRLGSLVEEVLDSSQKPAPCLAPQSLSEEPSVMYIIRKAMGQA